ncbi:LysR family transcriptional regulator [Variovorax sp. J22R115]|uniref:LysR family transcriptional regulator n=1 Tax=Variovorax sp. J22R115 TaxID=3053509 RepID=UPI0025779948|nr:LysR family transcriptional regulator [Variovorax sp. J22R115]MDM0048817.1 LysR family transcriptional regulator [Variovorax sp. J22R115]
MDLKLLAVFDEVYKTRSVSRAGENLGVAQSSISISLARLRRHFGDPLFVRTSEGMQPTPHATSLVAPVRQALELLRGITRQQAMFDPAKAQRTFRICMTDITHLVLLPALVNRLGDIAPGISVEITLISGQTPKMLESGEADLAVGFMPQLEAGFYQQKLFEQDFACVVRRNHPRVHSRLSQAMFKRENHALVTAIGTGHTLVEEELQRLGVKRNVALRLPNFLGIGGLVASTDLVVTVPRRVAETLARIADVKLLPPPFQLPVFAIKQHWHDRYQQDPANRWLRSVISDLFLE